MLKHTLCILNEILLQGSLSFHWHVATRLQLFHFFYGQKLSVHLYLCLACTRTLCERTMYHRCIIT